MIVGAQADCVSAGNAFGCAAAESSAAAWASATAQAHSSAVARALVDFCDCPSGSSAAALGSADLFLSLMSDVSARASAAACAEGTETSGAVAFADCIALAYSRVFATASANALIDGECLDATAAASITASVDAEFETIEGCETRGADSVGDAAADTDVESSTSVEEIICGAFGEVPCDGAGCDAGGFDAASPRGNSGIADGICVSSCGEPSWRCCDADDTGARCFQPNFACIAEEGVDGQGVPFTMACRPCGALGEPVCTEPAAPALCNDGLAAEDGRCVDCGALGEAPCDGAPFFLCCFVCCGAALAPLPRVRLGKVCDAWRPAALSGRCFGVVVEGDLFAECFALCFAVPFRLGPPWIVAPPVLCFAHCAKMFKSVEMPCLCCTKNKHQLGLATRLCKHPERIGQLQPPTVVL